MGNEITQVDMDSLLKVTQNTAMSASALSESLGIVTRRVAENTQRIATLESRMDSHERTETIGRAECRRIRKAVMARVNEVLEIKFRGGKVADESVADDMRYRGGFIARLYTDAKNHSRMGESYTETLKVDLEEVMDYISKWGPEVEGDIEGYKQYLDIRRDERRKHSMAGA